MHSTSLKVQYNKGVALTRCGLQSSSAVKVKIEGQLEIFFAVKPLYLFDVLSSHAKLEAKLSISAYNWVIAKSGLMAYGLMALWPYGLRFFIASSYNTTSLQSSRLHWVHASS